MKISEKKTLIYNNPEHSDKDLQKQLAEMERIICDSLDLPKPRNKIVGQYMGKDIYESDIKFDPEKNVYVIGMKDGSVVEVDPKQFSYSAEVKKSFEDWYKEYAATRVADAKAIYGVASDSQGFDPLRARVEAAGASAGAWKIDGLGACVRPADMGDWSVRFTDKAFDKLKANSVYGVGKAQARASAPWEDPLKGMMDKAQNTVACCDLPEPELTSGADSNIKVYYHDRYPSIPRKSIIDDAIELLNNKKNLHITKISFHTGKFGDQEISLAFAADHPTDPGLRKILEVIFTKKAFDRAYDTEIDKYAKLKARLDTNTFIKLRIAFLLYQALKLNDSDAKKISLDIFRIFSSNTRPNFHI